MTPAQLKKKAETLTNAFLFLEDDKETFQFLKTLLSQDELLELQQRLNIAVRLYFGTPYTQIEKELGVSSTTIARVSKVMKTRNNGYLPLIKKMYENTEE